MKVDSLVDGKEAMLDWRTLCVVSQDMIYEADAVVWRGEKPPGPGPRKCWNCGFEWTLKPGECK